MHRDNHYEAAFEAYLRDRRLPYIAVDEARRSLVADGSLKSLDFIVSPAGRTSWLVDVKGRRFPSGEEQKQYWKNWSTRDDLRSLAGWQAYFGPDFCPLLVFAYHLVGSRSPLPLGQLFEFRGGHFTVHANAVARDERVDVHRAPGHRDETVADVDPRLTAGD